MCFFKKIKIINPNLNITNHELILQYKLKRKGLKLNTQLVVPRNFAFVLTNNETVLDIFTQGEYNLTVRNIPKTSKKLNLYTGDFRKLKKYAKVDTYFVNLNDFDNNIWQTLKKVDLENKEYGIYKFFASGKYSFKIVDTNMFVKFLKTNLQTITPESSKMLIENYINNEIANILYQKNYDPELLFNLDKSITNNLAIKTQEILLPLGVKLINFTFEKSLFPPKVQKSLEKKALAKKIAETSNENKSKDKTQFVTIEKSAPGSKNFFKESMPPYFFAEEEKPETDIPKQTTKKSKWVGVLEQEKLEKEKSFVNLNSEDDDK